MSSEPGAHALGQATLELDSAALARLPEAVLPEDVAPSTERPSEVAIRVENLSKSYRIGATMESYQTLRDTLSNGMRAPFRWMSGKRTKASDSDRVFTALQEVSFEVRRGDVMGIIGRNGAGKSTLLKILSRITEPTTGRAEIHGRVGSLLEVGTGFHYELTGRENIYLNGAILGMRHADIQARFDEIVAFAEISRFVDTPVKHYSSGMYLRLAFAVAAHLETEILLVDEVLAVGDAVFQKKCLGKMEDVSRAGRTVLFVSHNMAAVRALCTTGLVLHEARVVQAGEIGRCLESYFDMIGAFQAGTGAGGSLEPKGSGFGPVTINGARAYSVSQGEAFCAETTLRIDQEVAGFTLFCKVQDMQNRPVFILREESTALGLSSVGQGRYPLRLDLPPLWLNTGLYSLHFEAYFWGRWGDPAHVSDRIPLDVMGLHSSSESVLCPPGKWTVSVED